MSFFQVVSLLHANGIVEPTLDDIIRLSELTGIHIDDEIKSMLIGGVIEVEKTSVEEIKCFLSQLMKTELPSNSELASLVKEKSIEKYDEYLPEQLLNEGYGYRAFDTIETFRWLT